MSKKKTSRIYSRVGAYLGVGVGVLLLLSVAFLDLPISVKAFGMPSRTAVTRGKQFVVDLSPQNQIRRLEICADEKNNNECRELNHSIEPKIASIVITIPRDFPLGRAVIVGHLREANRIKKKNITDSVPVVVSAAEKISEE